MNFASTSRTITRIITILGSLILAALGIGAAIPTIATFAAGPSAQATQTASVHGVTDLHIEASASDFTLRFADVPEATLQHEGNSANYWRLEATNGRLEATNTRGFGGICIGWCSPIDEQVTLTLPNHLNGGQLAASLELAAGKLDATGEFSHLDLEVGAGLLRFVGAADTVTTELGAGTAHLEIDGVQEADFEIAAGQVIARLTGEAPTDVALEVSAGKLDLTLPDVVYDVRTDLALGSLDNGLRTASDSTHRIRVEVAVGQVQLTPERR